MATNDYKYVLSSDSRVFIRQTPNCCPSDYTYHSCMRLDGIEENLGEVTSGYCPSDTNIGEFVEVVQILGAPERATSNLVGRIPANYESILFKLKKRRCKFDVQLHYGKCINPTDFTTFEFALVLEDVIITNYSTDQLGALTPDETALINETVTLSVGNYYYLRKLGITNLMQKYPLVFNGFEGSDVILCGPEDCPNCCDDECVIFVLMMEIATNVLWVFASKDGGVNWRSSNTGVGVLSGTLPSTNNISCYNGRLYLTDIDIVTVNQDFGVVLSTDISDIFSGTATWVIDWQAIDISDTRPRSPVTWFQDEPYLIVGRDNMPGVDQLKRVIRINIETGNTFEVAYNPNRFDPSNFPDDNMLFKYKDEVMLCGVRYSTLTGSGIGYFAYTFDGYTWEEVEININGVAVTNVLITNVIPLSKNSWIAVTEKTGVSGYDTYCTHDAGVNWEFLGNLPVAKFSAFANNNVFYGEGSYEGNFVAWRSYNGGLDWTPLPDNGTAASYSLNVSPNSPFIRRRRTAVCNSNPNYAINIGESGIFVFKV